MRKYTYILQTHNPDKKYVVDNIVENISCGYCRQYCEKKYIVNNVVARPGWLVSRCNTTKKVDDNSYKINSLTRRGQPIATDRDADDVSIHIVKSGQSLEHCNGIENSRLAIIHVGPSLFGVKCTKIHVDAPAKIIRKCTPSPGPSSDPITLFIAPSTWPRWAPTS